MSSKPGYLRDPAMSGTLPSASLVAAATATAANNSSSSMAESSSNAGVSNGHGHGHGPSSSPNYYSYSSVVAYVGERTGMSVAQAEQAVAWSAITGSGLLATKVALYAYRSLRGDGKIEDEISDCTESVLPKDDDDDDDHDLVPKDVVTKKKQRRTTSYSILGLIRRTMRRILLEESEFIARAPSAATEETGDSEEPAEGSLVSYQGSCHCESIQFTVLAPRVLTAQDGPGKIQFRHTQVQAEHFRVYAGYEYLRTYYVFYHATGNKGAHAFCERCGVHVLYAPSKTTPYLSINVRCFREEDTGKMKLTSKKDGISDGIPVAGQFDNVNNVNVNVNFSDHLSTISEVTQPFHFQKNHSSSSSSSFSNFANYQQQLRPANRPQRRPSDLESSIVHVDGAIEVFYPNQPERKARRPPQPPMTPTTSSLTTTEEAESSGSVHKGQQQQHQQQLRDVDGMGPMIPTTPPRAAAGGPFFPGDIFTEDNVSLMGDDNLSSASPKSATISIRRGDRSSRNSIPRHPTVTSPETRNKMKFFMSKYKKQSAA
mmetsp:Transcript_6657/g.19174  ORF Transcript_6657/g.19174 Transcript_6657/m.19174 type:complete len:543 (+) Transcript_6657:351-1979(+)